VASPRRSRRLLGGVCALGLALAGCGGAAATPSARPSAATSASSDARLLTSGLAQNLDKLTSYRFSEVVYSSWTGSLAPASVAVGSAAASPTGSAGSTAGTAGLDHGLLRIDGVVVNRGGSRSVQLTMNGVEYIIVGNDAWVSVDGTVWASTDESGDVIAQLPAGYYAIWFDKHVSGFTAVGTEDHDGVSATHFSGTDSLGNLYASRVGASFQADLWIAVDGSYPVGGRYLVPTGGSVSGYSFEIAAVNDAGNAVAEPSNVVALPT